MELTEERVREIVREEIGRHEREIVAGVADGLRNMRLPVKAPGSMLRIEALNLVEMGLDPFEEAEKPKPDWMTYPEAAELRSAGTDPMSVSRETIRDNREERLSQYLA